jgi:hypothetical protein
MKEIFQKSLDKQGILWYNIYNKEREGNTMKCPNCGSTAQVCLVWQDEDLPTHYHYKEFKCGCGCRFMATYELVEVKIVKDDGDT